MVTRYAKIVLVAMLAAFAALAALNNLTDYSSNFNFVQHVLSMDTTFPGNAAMWRAVNAPWLWHGVYWLIIAGEALSATLLAGGALMLWRARQGSGQQFNDSKDCAIAGLIMGLLVWFFGFMVIGGEWFLMWQSQEWNGQNAAFKFYAAILGVLVFLNQSDTDCD
ncbi:hypothetical protein ALP39_00943 [Pseudomonas marginalis pv. marginalis]|nr:hypothetical protein ALP39_00943 [Pseudomonas marginalis pv. marginalis]